MRTSSKLLTLQSMHAIKQSLLGLPIFSDSGLIQRLFGRAGGNKAQTVDEE